MGMFRRARDILSANISDLVERLEDPEKILRQVIREMEDAVLAALRGAARVVAEEKLLQRELDICRHYCPVISRTATTG
jgi:phage shock protein A